MSWILIALIGPFASAISNLIDKYLVEKYFKGGESGALVLFSALFSIVALPFVLFLSPESVFLGLKTSTILTLNGTINIICLIFYFKALDEDDASTVVPYYQLIPVFGFFLGYLILGETIGFAELLGCLIVVLGLGFLSVDFGEEKINFKKKVVFLMCLSSLLFAFNGVVFKFFAIDVGFWPSLFWEFSGNVVVGLFILLFFSAYRKQFFGMLKSNSWPVLSLSSLNELIYILGEGFAIYATLLAPIVLIMTFNGFQPVFVFIFSLILSILFPKTFKESLHKKSVIKKSLSLLIILIGIYFLSRGGKNL